MGNGLRQTTGMRRRGERIPLVTRVEIRTADDVLFDGQACCTNIGLGGLRVTARRGLAPGTRVYASLRLPSGRCFDGEGRVAWLHTTVHPALLGAPRGSRDEACFGIAFDGLSTQHLLPIARLLVAREGERRRARRIRRLHCLPARA